MAAGGMYTIGGSFWEFGEPDWEHAKYFMLFGVAEDHNSNPIKIGIGKLKKRGAKIVSINPIRTGYSAVADEWIGIRPGTDGLFVFSLIHELLRAGKIDAHFLARYTNAGWLVVQDPGAADDGLIARGDGAPLVYDRNKKSIASAFAPDVSPALSGEYMLDDGRRAVPAFALLAARYLDERHSPDVAAKEIGVPATTIRRIAAELAYTAFETPVVIDRPWTDWAGRRHDTMIGRPISIHAMRGISAHSNGFHTCRALHVLQALLGAIDTPGAFRYEPPYPKPVPPAIKPAGASAPDTPLAGSPLGFPRGPDDLLVDANGEALRIDKAFSWEAPLAVHGMIHTVIANAVRGDPYPIDTLFLYMANMAWNSAMNTSETMAMLAEREPGHRRLSHPAHHLFRCLLFGDGGLCRPDPAGYDLPRALRLHFIARPADQHRGSRRRRHSPAGDRARSRRAAVSGRADRARRPAQPAGTSSIPTARQNFPVSIRTTSSITSAVPASACWRAGAAPMAATAAPAQSIRGSWNATSKMSASGAARFRRRRGTSSRGTRPI